MVLLLKGLTKAQREKVIGSLLQQNALGLLFNALEVKRDHDMINFFILSLTSNNILQHNQRLFGLLGDVQENENQLSSLLLLLTTD